MKKRLRNLALPALGLASVMPWGTALAVDPPDVVISRYIGSMNKVASALAAVTDGNTAMRNAPPMETIITNELNPNQAAVDQAFANPANKAAFDAAAKQLSDARASLDTQMQRFSNGCSLEATSKSISGGELLQVTMVNKLPITVTVFWLDYTGKRVSYGSIPPGGTWNQGTYKTHPWVFADPSGKCVGFLNTKITANFTVIPDLSKSMEPTLKLITGSTTL